MNAQRIQMEVARYIQAVRSTAKIQSSTGRIPYDTHVHLLENSWSFGLRNPQDTGKTYELLILFPFFPTFFIIFHLGVLCLDICYVLIDVTSNFFLLLPNAILYPFKTIHFYLYIGLFKLDLVMVKNLYYQ